MKDSGREVGPRLERRLEASAGPPEVAGTASEEEEEEDSGQELRRARSPASGIP